MVLDGAKVEFETRVQEARSHCQVAVDATARELLKQQDWLDDNVDGDELERRKVAARQEAAAGYAPLTKLDQAFAEYNATIEARLRAKAAEDALEAALAELERGHEAGPSRKEPAMVLDGAKVEFETRVQEARSHCQVAVDATARELLKQQDWLDDNVDGDELERRKVAARQEAAAGYAPLTKLDQAFAEYNATIEARLRAKAAEDALEAALAELERGQAGPSGVE